MADKKKEKRAVGARSLSLCVSNCLVLLGACAYRIVFPDPTKLFENLDAELPALTQMILGVSKPVWIGVALGLVVFLIAKEKMIKNKHITATINLICLLALGAMIAVMALAIFLPLAAGATQIV